jgi:hypothetical protein
LKRTKTISCFLLIAAVIFLFQCKKSANININMLPAITADGKNTFGCELNGKVWVPYQAGCGDYVTHLDAFLLSADTPRFANGFPQNFFLRVVREDVSNPNNFSSFEIRNYYGGTPEHNTMLGIGNVYDSLSIGYTNTDDQHSYGPVLSGGQFQITTFDTVKNIIAGTFQFALADNAYDSIFVTNGRFDLQLTDFAKCSN